MVDAEEPRDDLPDPGVEPSDVGGSGGLAEFAQLFDPESEVSEELRWWEEREANARQRGPEALKEFLAIKARLTKPQQLYTARKFLDLDEAEAKEKAAREWPIFSLSSCEAAKADLAWSEKESAYLMKVWSRASADARDAGNHEADAHLELTKARNALAQADARLNAAETARYEAREALNEAEKNATPLNTIFTSDAYETLRQAESAYTAAEIEFKKAEFDRKNLASKVAEAENIWNAAAAKAKAAQQQAAKAEETLNASIRAVEAARAAVEKACAEKPSFEWAPAEYTPRDEPAVQPGSVATGMPGWLKPALAGLGVVVLAAGAIALRPGGDQAARPRPAAVTVPASGPAPQDGGQPPSPAPSASPAGNAGGFQVDYGGAGIYSSYSPELKITYKGGTSAAAKAVSWLVCDSSGKHVTTIPLRPQDNLDPGLRSRRWKSSGAAALPPGRYRVTVVAEAADGRQAKLSFLFDPSREIPESERRQPVEECHAQ